MEVDLNYIRFGQMGLYLKNYYNKRYEITILYRGT